MYIYIYSISDNTYVSLITNTLVVAWNIGIKYNSGIVSFKETSKRWINQYVKRENQWISFLVCHSKVSCKKTLWDKVMKDEKVFYNKVPYYLYLCNKGTYSEWWKLRSILSDIYLTMYLKMWMSWVVKLFASILFTDVGMCSSVFIQIQHSTKT